MEGRQAGREEERERGGEGSREIFSGRLSFLKNSLAAVDRCCWARISLLAVSKGYSSLGSSGTRDQTCVPCIGRRILIH